jgi:GNAT superfamily N-acetyltransferase
MNPSISPVFLSAIDEERFGIRTAKALHVTLDVLPSVVDFCKANNVTLLIARTLTSDLSVAQAMEREGFNLMDTLVYYLRDLVRRPIPATNGNIPIRPISLGEEEKVKVVAAEAFRGYFGHYHADERLERAKCDETYVSWAVRSSFSKEVADEVLVAELKDTIVGFATLRMKTPEEGEGVLFGVAPTAQGLGIYSLFIIHGMEWCLSRSAKCMLVSTQITNIAVQKVWSRLGFEPSHSYYTFHKWFDQS